MTLTYVKIKSDTNFTFFNPHTANLQQTTLRTFSKISEKISINEGIITENSFKTLWHKGEIAHFEQFLLLPQCFQETPNASVKVTE